MSRGLNKVLLLGHLGKDPELRVTEGGTIIAQMALATSDRRKDNQGEWQDATEWHNLVAFNRIAEVCRDYLRKGSQVYVEGKIQTRSWDDRENGIKRYRTEILVNELIMLGSPAEGLGKAQPTETHENGLRQPAGVAPNIHGMYIEDSEIPF